MSLQPQTPGRAGLDRRLGTSAAFPITPPLASLQLVDELSHKLVGAAQPLHFDIARTEAQRTAVFRLRYAAVIAHGWAPPEAMPDGMERDSYDQYAIHITAWDGDVLAATTRLILPAPGRLLPTEAAFGLTVEPQGRVADMGRQTVARAYSNMRHRVFAAILAKTWLEMRSCGYSLVCGDFSAGMLRLYRMLGFKVTQLGPAQQHSSLSPPLAHRTLLGASPRPVQSAARLPARTPTSL
jgi:N-acyl-L-homoserine lactone synthetase